MLSHISIVVKWITNRSAMSDRPSMRKKVVILDAGYAGTFAAANLLSQSL